MKGLTPKIGFVTMALPGYYLGDEMCQDKHDEGLNMLKKLGYDVCDANCVYSPEQCREKGEYLNNQNIDCDMYNVLLDNEDTIVLLTYFVINELGY